MGYSKYEHPVDESTGLPKLPDNLFWRIRPDNIGDRQPRMVIVEKIEYQSGFWKWKKTKVKHKETGFYSWVFHGLEQSNIQYAANEIMRKYQAHLKTLENQKLLGDYPPNKLS